MPRRSPWSLTWLLLPHTANPMNRGTVVGPHWAPRGTVGESGCCGACPKDIRLLCRSEVDATPFNRDGYQLYGLYGFGHFLECFDSSEGFTPACEAAMVHCDPGAFGFYRKRPDPYSNPVTA